MTTPKKPDRRIQRTREALRDALIALIVERGYDAVNIQDITDRANVARTTFYLHFRDKEDLLFSTMKEVYEELIGRIHTPNIDALGRGDIQRADSADFEHIQQHKEFYKIMLGEHGSMAFFTRVQGYLAEVMNCEIVAAYTPPGQTPRLPADLIGYMLTGMQLAMFMWWLQRDCQPSAAQMAQWGEDFVVRGMLWALSWTPD